MTQNGGAITLATVIPKSLPSRVARVSGSGSSKRQQAPSAGPPWEINIGSSSSYSRIHYGAQGSAFVRAFKEFQLLCLIH